MQNKFSFPLFRAKVTYSRARTRTSASLRSYCVI